MECSPHGTELKARCRRTPGGAARGHPPRPSGVPGTQADFCFAAAPPRPCEDRRGGLPQHASHLAPLTPVRGSARSAGTDPAPAHACVEHATRSMPGGPAGCPAQAKPKAASGSRALLSAKIPRASKAKRHAPSTPRRIRNTARQRPKAPALGGKSMRAAFKGIPGIDGRGTPAPFGGTPDRGRPAYGGRLPYQTVRNRRSGLKRCGSGQPGIRQPDGRVSRRDKPIRHRRRATRFGKARRCAGRPSRRGATQAKARRTRPAGHGPEARRKAGGAASLIVWKRPAR